MCRGIKRERKIIETEKERKGERHRGIYGTENTRKR